MKEAFKVAEKNPILIDKFIDNAMEVDVDAISDGKNVFVAGIMQHIEEAGIHSGDSACVLPPFKIKDKSLKKIIDITEQIALKLNVKGLINLQFAYKDSKVFVLEVNPRASRTIPFASKTTNVPLAKVAAQLAGGAKLKDFDLKDWNSQKHIAVKEAVLPFNKFPDESIFLSPEMKSTGEVMGISKTMGQSFFRASISAGNIIPKNGRVFISVNDSDKKNIIPVAKRLSNMGFSIIATAGTSDELNENQILSQKIFKVGEGRPNVVDGIKNGDINLVINTPLGAQSRFDEEAIGRACIKKGILAITTLSGANAAIDAICEIDKNPEVKSIQEYHL